MSLYTNDCGQRKQYLWGRKITGANEDRVKKPSCAWWKSFYAEVINALRGHRIWHSFQLASTLLIEFLKKRTYKINREITTNIPLNTGKICAQVDIFMYLSVRSDGWLIPTPYSTSTRNRFTGTNPNAMDSLASKRFRLWATETSKMFDIHRPYSIKKVRLRNRCICISYVSYS